VKAVETVDRCLGDVVYATLQASGRAIVTADHGNAEEMIIPGTNDVWTAHTMNQVPLVIVANDDDQFRHAEMVPEGRLADIAPTILKLMGLEIPPQMTGTVLCHANESYLG
jgi:2,3-bisphosphoglycerate-independent phosphoglycerate mutase